MITPPGFLVSLVQPWSDFYADSKLTATVVTCVHVGGLLFAGGIAIAADRATLAADADGRTRQLAALTRAHSAVLWGLIAIVVSGLLLVTSDLEEFWGSPIYWIKMGLFVVLLVNGYRMRRAEGGAATGDAVDAAAWSTIRSTAKLSLVLWFAVTFLGVALVNFA